VDGSDEFNGLKTEIKNEFDNIYFEKFIYQVRDYFNYYQQKEPNNITKEYNEKKKSDNSLAELGTVESELLVGIKKHFGEISIIKELLKKEKFL
jgi:hypothetical protein